MDYLKGAILAAVVNVLNMAAWFVFGPLIPSAIMAFVTLLITGIYGSDNKWGFVLGYWVVQLFVIALWLFGIVGAANLLRLIGAG